MLTAVISGLLLTLPLFSGLSLPVASASTFPKSGGLDCNGFSTVQAPVDLNLQCRQPLGPNGVYADNGYYVGHDEPTVDFYSNVPGSGNNMTYKFVLPQDPSAATSFHSYKDYVTFWVGMDLCDNQSYPQNSCLPDSDLNTGMGIYSNDAGSAFMELQFYPPAWPQFVQNVSCSLTQWCVAMNIDSLECTFRFLFCNPVCEEPVNFAFLTPNGIPIAPPSPQHQNSESFDFPPNPNVFLMNSGDIILASLHDTPNGLETFVKDLTTGKSAFMIASAADGFMNTNIANCLGTPYSFHPEYSSAGPNNLLPWGALQNNIAIDVEIGHYQIFDHNDADDTSCPGIPPGQTHVACLSTDFDYDGFSYVQKAWPSTVHATTLNAMPVTFLPLTSARIGPQSNGKAYPIFQLATETGYTLGSPPDNACNLLVPNSCSVQNLDFLPTYAGFYPYYSTVGCNLVFGNVNKGHNVNTFAGIAGYGPSIPTYEGSTEVFGSNAADYANHC